MTVQQAERTDSVRVTLPSVGHVILKASNHGVVDVQFWRVERAASRWADGYVSFYPAAARNLGEALITGTSDVFTDVGEDLLGVSPIADGAELEFAPTSERLQCIATPGKPATVEMSRGFAALIGHEVQRLADRADVLSCWRH